MKIPFLSRLRGSLMCRFERGLLSMPEADWLDWVQRLTSRKVEGLSAREQLVLLFRLQERVAGDLDLAAIRYGDGLHPKHRFMRYEDFFVERTGAGDEVLDIGCSYGVVASAIAERAGARVTGIDLNERHIAEAEKRFPHERVTYVVGDALEDLPEGDFNVIVLSNVLEHLPGRAGFLKRVVSTYHPERLLIRVPLFDRDCLVPLRKELGLEWRLDKTHETEYTQESFDAEMAEAGLRITHKEIRWGEIWAEVKPGRE
jgi:SAM-dependent methyltransferase